MPLAHPPWQATSAMHRRHRMKRHVFSFQLPNSNAHFLKPVLIEGKLLTRQIEEWSVRRLPPVGEDQSPTRSDRIFPMAEKSLLRDA